MKFEQDQLLCLPALFRFTHEKIPQLHHVNKFEKASCLQSHAQRHSDAHGIICK